MYDAVPFATVTPPVAPILQFINSATSAEFAVERLRVGISQSLNLFRGLADMWVIPLGKLHRVASTYDESSADNAVSILVSFSLPRLC